MTSNERFAVLPKCWPRNRVAKASSNVKGTSAGTTNSCNLALAVSLKITKAEAHKYRVPSFGSATYTLGSILMSRESDGYALKCTTTPLRFRNVYGAYFADDASASPSPSTLGEMTSMTSSGDSCWCSSSARAAAAAASVSAVVAASIAAMAKRYDR